MDPTCNRQYRERGSLGVAAASHAIGAGGGERLAYSPRGAKPCQPYCPGPRSLSGNEYADAADHCVTVCQGARGGFRSALAVQLGSLIGDVVWAVVGLVGVGLLIQLDSLRTPISIASVIYLIWLSWEAWRASRSKLSVNSIEEGNDCRRAFQAGSLLSLTNPQHVAYWAAMGSALAGLIPVRGVRRPRVPPGWRQPTARVGGR
jgi:LysE type translocator